MEDYPIRHLRPLEAFPMLAELPDQPRTLHIRGTLDRMQGTKYVTVVGSRKCTSYGRNVCQSLIAGLAGYPITIVSGLALGIDGIAHQAAIDAGLPTIAFPGSGLNWNALYPAAHHGLAQRILSNGGALISEYDDYTVGAPWTFPRRNRLEAGISDITIIIEAQEKSGTLITARLGTEYNKIVGAVPGPITSDTSRGTNWLLKLGAVPITESADILRELNLAEKLTSEVSAYLMLNADEERVLALLNEPKSREEIMHELDLDAASANMLFSTLEIKGVIRETLGYIERML